MGKAFDLTISDQGIARLTFDLEGEKVNKFSTEVMYELKTLVDHLENDNKIKALVITSAKKGIFIAGADIKEIQSVSSVSEMEQLATQGQDLFNQIQNLPFPSIAVIDGACMGGGMEFSLACTYRMATDDKKTKLGLPEVQLGLVPGWGGTQRMPKLVGLMKGLDLVMSGRALDGRKAFKMGVVDALIAREFLDSGIDDFVSKILDPKGRKAVLARRKKLRSGLFNWLMEKNPLGRMLVYRGALKNVMAKTKGHYPAPLRALEVIKQTYGKSLNRGLPIEARAIAELSMTPECRNLVGLFFLNEAIKREPGTKLTAEPKDPSLIKNVAVLGAGIMGGGITWAFTRKGHSVLMKDINWDGIAKGYQAANKMYDALLKRRKIKPHEKALGMHRINGVVDYSSFNTVDVVVEAVVEKMEVKKQVFQELEEQIREDTIVVSNTSSLPITEMAKAFKHPERFAGMHFFNPVNRMPLVEIIRGEKTSPETIATLVKLTQSIGKTPIVVKDCPGFLVNRVLIPCLNEAGWMLEEGVEMERIDRVASKFGMPMGAFLLSDEVGLDVAAKVAYYLHEGYGERFRVPAIFDKMVAEKFFGKKCGTGFYIHDKKTKKHTINPKIAELVGATGSPPSLTDQEISDRLIFAMVGEAARCLEEGIIDTAPYLDMAMIMGTGFPPFHGGLMRYADSRGLKEVVGIMEEFAKKYGERFVPNALLKKLSENNQTFYETKGPEAHEQQERLANAT